MPHTKGWPWVLVALVCGTVALSAGHFENPDAHLRLSQAFSIAQGHGFRIPEWVGNPLHGNIAEGVDGHWFSVYAPGQIVCFVPTVFVGTRLSSYIGLQPHYAAEFLGSFFGVGVHLITGLFVYRAARFIGHSQRSAGFCAMAFTFATFNLPSSRDGYEHPYESLAIIAALTFAWSVPNPSRPTSRHGLIAGMILGLGILFRATTLLGVPALLITLPSARARLGALLGLSPAMLTMGWYNVARFGSPIDTGYLAAWRSAHPDLSSATGFSIADLPVHTLGLWLSPGKGMMVFSPIVIACLAGAWLHLKRQPRAVTAIAVACITYTTFYGANFAWHGSAWCWGPRYLVPLTPLLILLLPDRTATPALRGLSLGLAAVSFVLQSLALMVSYKRHLMTLFVASPSVFENGDIFFQPRLSPIVALLEQFPHYVKGLLDPGPLYLFHADGPWVSERRPVGLATMLDHSIDLNAIDLWWVRVLYLPIPEGFRLAALGLGLACLCGLVLATRRVIGMVGNSDA